ncbi:MAG: hypothetical protein ACTSPV_01075 [Candidatus Hodarchaeales archaeon]
METEQQKKEEIKEKIKKVFDEIENTLKNKCGGVKMETEKFIVCEYCGEKAKYDTCVNGIYVCDKVNCLSQFAEQQCCKELEEEDHKKFGEDRPK